MPDELGIGPTEAAGIVDAEQRQFASGRPDRQQHFEVRQRGTAAGQALGQRLDGRRLEQAADADIGIHARANPADQPDRQQRVPAELEEIVVDADPLDAEHLGKQPAEDFLLRRARRAARVRRRQVRLGQRAAVELAVRRQRQLVESDDRRRHHVVRQAGAEVLAQRRRRNAPSDRHHIGDQPLVPRHVLARDHRRLRHAALPQQRRLDLAGLDPEPAELHLRVRPAQEFQHAVRAPARQVAGPVHPAAGGPIRVGDEPLRRQPRAMQIASRQSLPGDVKLARNSRRHRLKSIVQHIGPIIGHRTSDRDIGADIIVGDGMGNGIDGGFGRTIEIGDLRDLEMVRDLVLELQRKSLAPERQMLQGQRCQAPG